MFPLLHNSKYTLHEKMTNGLGKFEEGQGSVIHVSLVWKAAQGLPVETLCPFNDLRQTLYWLLIILCLHSADEAIILFTLEKD